MLNYVTGAFAEQVLKTFISDGKFLSLHFKQPDNDQPSLTEPAFGGYERKGVQWVQEGAGLCANLAPVTFVGLEPPVTVAAIGVCQGQYGSNLIAVALFDEPITSGRTTYVIPAGFLKFRAV